MLAGLGGCQCPLRFEGSLGALRFKFNWHCCEMYGHWQTEACQWAVPVTNRISPASVRESAGVDRRPSLSSTAMAVDQGLPLCSFFQLASS